MRYTRYIPYYNIVVANGPVLCRPLCKAIVNLVACRVPARGKNFIIVILRYPKLVIEKTCFFTQQRAIRYKCFSLLPGHKHVPNIAAIVCMLAVIYYMPVAVAFIINVALRILFIHKHGRLCYNGVAVRVSGACWYQFGIHLHHTVVLIAINIHVQPENKKMLVVHGLYMRVYKRTVRQAVI